MFGWCTGSELCMNRRALEAFRNRQFWSRAARYSYAAVLVSDGFFLLQAQPHTPAFFFLFAALAGVVAPEVGLLALVLGAHYLL